MAFAIIHRSVATRKQRLAIQRNLCYGRVLILYSTGSHIALLIMQCGTHIQLRRPLLNVDVYRPLGHQLASPSHYLGIHVL